MKIEDCKVGMKVLFGRMAGEKTLGEIVKVNSVKCKVKQLESRGTMRDYKVGTMWNIPPSMMSPVGGAALVTTLDNAESFFMCGAAKSHTVMKRSDAEIMRDIQDVRNQLSPENLHCDGEISRPAAARKETLLNARLRELFAEKGTTVPCEDAAPMFNFRWSSRIPYAPAKACPFKKGDKVCFTVSKTGEVVVGYVRTLNVKTVTVDPIGGKPGAYWKVPPSKLKAA